jgi:predicted HTH domain antitoxin
VKIENGKWEDKGPDVGQLCRAKLGDMEVKLHIPDDVAKRLSARGGDVSRRALEAIALEGYREQTLTLYQVSEMLGLSRVETEDFLGRHHVPLAVNEQADLDREAAMFEAASRRSPHPIPISGPRPRC